MNMDCRRIQSFVLIALAACTLAAAQEAPIPAATELSGRPYAIKDKWVIGGIGNWDYLTLDPVARQLFIARQGGVQVVDVESGAVAATIGGFADAHAVVLDPDGQWGYVSDGRAYRVVIFDRRTFHIEAHIALPCSPRSMVYDRDERLLFAMCGAVHPQQTPPPPRQSTRPPAPPATQRATGLSHIIAIDTEAREVLADLPILGDLRTAQLDGRGSIYITVGPTEDDPLAKIRGGEPRIAVIDAAAIAEEARKAEDTGSASDSKEAAHPKLVVLANGMNRYEHSLRLGHTCPSPQGLAIDSDHFRLFVACEDQAMLVLDSRSGAVISTLTTGPGTDAIAYDPGRGLIFTANGGGYGSVTIARQHLTDDYAVIQNLPTMEKARTMAIDPSTGLVYVVTTLYGAKLTNPPANGIGKLQMNPVNGSFQVLVIGN